MHGSSGVLQDMVEKCNKYGGALKGAKGVDDDSVRKAVKLGINKVNIDTDLRLAWTATVREQLAQAPENIDPRKYLGPAQRL